MILATTPPLSAVSRPPAATPPRSAGDSNADAFLLAAEQAVRDELGIIDALVDAHAQGDVLPIAESRRCRTIADHLRARADMFEQLANRIVQEIS